MNKSRKRADMAWTNEEKKAYIPPVTYPLSSLYRHACIDSKEPEKRAEYLAEKVLKLTATDHDLFRQTAKQEGKAQALNLLERMFLSLVEGEDNFMEAILKKGGELELRRRNFAGDGYMDAQYSVSGPIIEIEGSFAYGFPPSKKIQVPSQIKVLTNNSTWEAFPIVFQVANDRNTENYSMLVFKADGSYYHTPYVDHKLIEDAQAKGLTQWSKADIKTFIREEE